LGYRKIGQPENSATKKQEGRKKGQQKLMPEITASKKQRKKMATGKLGNDKWAGTKKGNTK